MNFPPASRFFKFPLLILTVLALFLTAASPADSERIRCEDIQTVTGVESLGVVTFPTGTMFADTEVGGLSGIAYDANRGVYYVISDDRSVPRFYTVTIDLSEAGRSTNVALTQDRNESEEERSHSEQNWKTMLEGLKRYVEGT